MASTAITAPNLGLYYGLDPLAVPQRGLQDGRNFRVRQGRLTNQNIGNEVYSALNLGAPLVYIDTFYIRGATQKQILCTTRDVLEYDEETDIALLLNRRFATGTVAVSGTAVTGTGTGWVTAGIKAGDMIHFGNAAQRSLTATWYEIDAVGGETGITLTTSAGTIGAGSVYTIRRTFTGDVSDLWDSDTFVAPDDGVGDDLWIATNFREYPQSWDGAATQLIDHADLEFKCRRVAVFKNMLIYGNLELDAGDLLPTSIINSDVGKPFIAGALGAGISGQFRVHDGVDGILELEDMGDNLIVYSERKLIVSQFVGDPLVFAFREAASGVGPIASRLIADYGDYHEFIGTDSMYLFDGVTVTTVNEHVWREVLRTRDPTRQQLGFTQFDEEAGECIWALPLTSDTNVGDVTKGPEEAFVEHYLEEVGDRTPTPFSRRDFPFICPGYSVVRNTVTWAEMVGTWEEATGRWNDSFLFSAFPILLAGTTAGTLFKAAATQQFGGAFAESWVRFGRRPLGDGRMRGLLARVYPFAGQFAGTTMYVSIRLADHASGPVTAIQVEEFLTDLDEGEHFVTPYRRARYFELEFGTDGQAWQISGYDTDGKPGGNR